MKIMYRVAIAATAIALPLGLGACGGSSSSHSSAPAKSAPTTHSQYWQDGYAAGNAWSINPGDTNEPAWWAADGIFENSGYDPSVGFSNPPTSYADLQWIAGCEAGYTHAVNSAGAGFLARSTDPNAFGEWPNGGNLSFTHEPAPTAPTTTTSPPATTTPSTEAQSATPVQVPLTQAQCQQFEGSAGWDGGSDYGPPSSTSPWDCGQYSWPSGEAPAQPGSPQALAQACNQGDTADCSDGTTP